MLTRLLKTHLRRYWKWLAAIVVLQGVQATAALLLPTLNADIIDNGVLTGDTDYIWRLGGLMVVVTLVQVLFAIGATYYSSKVSMGFGRDVRGGLFHTVTEFSAQEVSQFGAPSLITRITNDVTQIQMLVLMSCTLLVTAPITVTVGVVMAVREASGLAWILAVSIPVLAVAVGIVVFRQVPEFQRMQDRIDRVNQVLREQITGMRVVRAFVREPHEAARFESANADLTETSLVAGRLQAFTFPTVIIVLNISSVAAIWIGSDQIAANNLQIGSLIAFLSYLAQIIISVTGATFAASMVPRAAVCANRVQGVLDTPSSVVSTATPVKDLPRSGLVELREVGFNYPGAEAPVLTNINLIARAGETTAIIGSTGAGKTTLLNLIPRLYDARWGYVLVDGVNVRDIAPEDLWSRIGLIPQKPFLFSGTIASNLRFGCPDATDAELWEALEVAQAADFVRAKPAGLDEPIAQGGTNVSGGQRQRLAIARALVKKPAVYLFDDSFSALDLTTDARLRAALGPVTRDAAVIIVAQRVSTIASANQILVLEDGHAVGLGTHDELLESCPTYVEIVESQRAAEEAA